MNTTPGDAPLAPCQHPWRVRDGAVVLLASRIGQRAALHFPPLPETSPLAACSTLVELHGTPVLYSYTIVHSSPKANKPPQPLGQVDFPEGLRVFGRLEMPDGRRPVIGEPLRTVLQLGADGTDGAGGAIYAFRPLEETRA